MEELRKLEETQRVVSLMQSGGVLTTSSNPDSNRFLANFINLLIQPCGELDIHAKCSLISHHMPKISASFLEKVSLGFNREGCEPNFVENNFQVKCEEEADDGLLQTDFQDAAMVGLDAMQRANSTLEDFCRSYFMFHGMDVNRPQSVFKYLPLLSFTESYIYQACLKGAVL